MERINVAELLRNCPSGMKLDSTLVDNLYFDCINDSELDDPYPIQCYTENGSYRTSIRFNEYGHYTYIDNSKCVIFPEGRTTWEGFHRPFINGDVIVDKYGAIALYKQVYDYDSHEGSLVDFHCGLTSRNKSFFVKDKDSLQHCGEISSIRFATEGERQELFQAIKDNGYKWNEETKTLEKLIEPKFKVGDKIRPVDSDKQYIIKNIELDRYVLNNDQFLKFTDEHIFELAPNKLVKPKFKVGDRIKHKTHISQGDVVTEIKNTHYILNDEFELSFTFQDEWELLVSNKFDLNSLVPFESRVLVRNDEHQYWIPAFWGCKRIDGYTTTFGWCRYCIPFEGNEHLLDSNNDCSEFFKTWK